MRILKNEVKLTKLRENRSKREEQLKIDTKSAKLYGKGANTAK